MKKTALLKALVCLTFIIGMIFITACQGVTVTPNDDGSITVSPIENNGDVNNSPNQSDSDVGINTEVPDDYIHIHSYKAVEIDENLVVSCTNDGIRVWRCDCGDEFTEYVSALGHQITSYERKDPTCLENGYTAYEKCVRENCDYSTYEIIPATGHQLVSLSDVEATCLSEGLTDRVECAVEECNYHSETIVAPLGHICHTVEGTAPTCTENGYSSYDICVREGCSSPDLQAPVVIPALGHDNMGYEGKDPTCTEFGWQAYDVCQRCGFSTYNQIDAIGHIYDNGYCACGHSDLGLHQHVWGEGYVITAATCVDSGLMGYVCIDENCGDTKNESIPPLGHNNVRQAAKEATCTSEGWYAYDECQRCGYNSFTSIPVRNHSYTVTITQQPGCTMNGIKTYTCSCGDSYDVEIEKLGHDWGSWYTVKDATCDASGQEQRVCMNNSLHVDMRTVSKLGHSFGEWIMVSAPTCSQQGQEKRVCMYNSAHVEIRGIPTIDHVVNASTGLCTYCGAQISYRLGVPVVSSVDAERGVIYWTTVDGADYYEVIVEPSGEYFTTKGTYINLESYYGANTQLNVKIRSMPMVGSPIMSSAYCEYVFTIPGQPIANSKGIGSAVNLLTGSYTQFASGTTSIFNEAYFNRLRVSETAMKTQYFESIYKDNLYGYVEELSSSIGAKLNMSVSCGVDKVAKVTSGYTLDITDSFEKQTQNQTNVVFYDLDYMYAYKGVEIYGYNDTEKLSSILSEEFKADAAKVQNGEMTPDAFITKYGTHIVTAATYGATFNLHYEMISSDGSIKTAFGTNVEEGIKNQISATLDGVTLGTEIGTSTETANKAMSTFSNASTYAKFVMRSSGGNATGRVATSLSEFAGAFESWVTGLDSSDDYVVIDVPDRSLFFVWDFLGDDYAEAKAILHNYFYASCDEQYYSVKDKISDMYKDSITFDEESGTLTVNLSGLQNYSSANLSGINYIIDGQTWFNSAICHFTVFSRYNGMEIKKVVFEGAYYTEDRSGRLITTVFKNLNISFDQWWSEDIVVEFRNFAYQASINNAALDFSKTNSENITIITTGNVYIKGGDGYSSAGNVAINAGTKNLTITGDAIVKIYGGNGSSGSGWGQNGQDGGDGILANELTVDITDTLYVYGGNGGNGYVGKDGNAGQTVGTYTLVYKDYDWAGFHTHNVYRYSKATDGTDGGRGGNGGNAGVPVVAKITSTDRGSVILQYGNGGNGAKGGKGGDGGKGHDYYGYGYSLAFIYSYMPGAGGNGGNGGKGGNAGLSVTQNMDYEGENIQIVLGSNGVVGQGGACGLAGSGGCGGRTSHGGNSHSATDADSGNNGAAGSCGVLNK